MTQLKEKLLSSFIAFEDQKDIDSYVHGIRTKAIKNFEPIQPGDVEKTFSYTKLL